MRILTAGDQSLLENCAPDVFDDPIDPRAASEFLADPRHQLAAAIEDGVVVGFASGVVYLHPDAPAPELWINEVGVAPSHRRQGLATRLLEILLEAGRSGGCTEAWVLTERSNDAAMGLYAFSGGREAQEDTVMFEFSLEPAQDEDG